MNCKPGDMALVVRAPITPEAIGLVVEVVRPAVDGEILCGLKFLMDGSVAWVVKSRAPLPVRSEDMQLRFVERRVFSDWCLIPISGVPAHDEERAEVTA